MLKVAKFITINGTKTLYKKMYKMQRIAGKDDITHLFSIVLTKAVFIVRGRTANFKLMYIKVVLCTGVLGVRKFCSLGYM